MRFKVADDLKLRPREWSILRYLLSQFPNGHLFEAFYKHISLCLSNEKCVNWRTWRTLCPPLQDILYCNLYCDRKCYFSSSEEYWQKQPREVFYQKVFLTDFSKFTAKHLCQNLSFKRLDYRFFTVNFLKFVGTLFLQSTFERLLLYLEPCQVSMTEVSGGNIKSLTVFARKTIIHV